MTLCIRCGMSLSGSRELCPHHINESDVSDWAATNRIMCNWIHRGRKPRRIPERDRTEFFWGAVPGTLEED